MQRIIFVVDDVPTNIELVSAVFENDSDIIIKSASNGKEFIASIEKDGLPDITILDLMMPEMDGFEVLTYLKELREKNYFPVIIISAIADKQSIIRALSLGADDYITKPFFVEELKLRVDNMLKIKERHEILAKSLDMMELNLLEKSRLLENSEIEIITRLGRAAEFRDDITGRHIERIVAYVNLLTEELGISRGKRLMMNYAAPMHDIGKLGIPDDILQKPGKLSEDEFNVIKLHTVIGAKIFEGTNLPLLELAREIALTHHERWDGNGYPLGLQGINIPISGSIVAITDVFDATTSNRIYKTEWTTEMAVDYIKKQREKRFSPDVTDAFLTIADRIIDIRNAKADEQTAKPIIQQVMDGEVNIEELIEIWR